jgi:hypothetical protein
LVTKKNAAVAIALIAIVVFAFYLISPITFANLFHKNTLASTMGLEIIDDRGNTVARFDPATQTMSIIATYGGTSTDITTMYYSTANYYWKLSPVVSPTFTTTGGSTSIQYVFTWNYFWYPDSPTITAFTTLYLLKHIAQSMNPISYPITNTLTFSSPVSGQQVIISDPFTVVLIKMKDMALPAVGASSTMQIKLTCVATLYVDGAAQNSVTESLVTTIKLQNNANTGTMQAIGLGIQIGSAMAMW